MIYAETCFEIRATADPEGTFQSFLSKAHPRSEVIYVDGCYRDSTGEAGLGIYGEGDNFRQGIDLLGCLSPLAAEIQATVRALRYVRVRGFVGAVFCTNSLRSLLEIGRSVVNYTDDYMIHKIANLLGSMNQNPFRVDLIWVPSHEGLRGNSVADRLARMASSLRVSPAFMRLGIRSHVMQEDIRNLIVQDYRAHQRLAWSYFTGDQQGQRYFERVSFKTVRPWFWKMDMPRGYIRLITRLRSEHFCVGAVFQRMNWNVSPICRCGADISFLSHYIEDCELFSHGRQDFLDFLNANALEQGSSTDKLDRLIFAPTMEVVQAVGNVFTGRGIII